ncbi:MAG: HD-GYP domain-containing protein, partial [Lachnospiraceae bacterium]|nr:HD-GYP domain-containing protein [Lachnospiraceae bacterium]
SGELILGTDGGGLFIVGRNGVTGIDTNSGMPSDIVLRAKKDSSRDIIWLITGNALAFMTGDRKIMTVREFPYSNNYDIYENKYEEMWILSSNGIYVVPKSELLENGRIDPMFYGIQNGLPCISTANSYSELTDDGFLYISGRTGVAKVNINDRNNAVNSIKMSVPYVEADGVMIYPEKDGSFILGPDVKKLVIYSFVYNYALSEPTVTYWLDGFDEEKTTVDRSDLGPIIYTNLKGKNYSFVMELQERNSNEQKSIAVTIVKKLAIHEQLWFRIMCILLAAGVVVAVVAVYLRRKMNAYRKKERENRILVREIVEAFAKVVDMKDKYTNGHSSRVADYTALLAEELGYDEETVDKFRNIALLHDIGKVGIPGEVLNKPGKLTDEEYDIIKSHSALGYETLKGISIMPDLAIGAGSHHERPDGKGYPKGLKAEEIPRVSQIIAVADTFDAMYSNRPYRKRMNFEKAVSIIKDASGTQLTPDVVEAFLKLVERGYFRAEDDDGSGETENIDNIHKKSGMTQ